MKIFVSWSGERSQKLAEALHTWLPLVLPYTVPWVSKSDIQAGERWSLAVATELQESTFGIICVTRDNMNAPWILFESGAIAKSMKDGRVIPLLLDLDLKEISGPLAQFQAKKADEEGFRQLIFDLNKAAPNGEPEDRITQRFDPMFASLRDKLDKIPSTGAHKTARAQGEIMEELVASVRSFEVRFRDVVDEEPNFRRRIRRRIHPGMIMDLTREISENPSDPIGILILYSHFKDEIPWLYEIAVEFYHAIVSNDRIRAKAARVRLKRATDSMRHGPFMDLMIGDKMTHMMLREAADFVPMLFNELGFEDVGDEIEAPRRRVRRLKDSAG